MITLEQYLTADGKYQSRKTHKEATPEVLDNARALLEKVNALLEELGVGDVKVSSGFRPSDVNAGIKGAAKKSLHMKGLALDLVDDQKGTLDTLIASRPDLLKKYDLWLEHSSRTLGWVHIDAGTRRDRPSRVFMP